ncbi:Uncharacterized protein pbN1_09440 [Aromatoleum bremense]|nr:Uncharacterized protein pbN1_09440 [Aromatoleum bremense]
MTPSRPRLFVVRRFVSPKPSGDLPGAWAARPGTCRERAAARQKYRTLR